MRRPKLSKEYREKLLQNIDRSALLKARKKRLYNRKYRKSFIFISTWAVRIIYIVLFVVVAMFYTKTGSVTNEKVESKNIDRYISHSKYGVNGAVSTLYLKTNVDAYVADISGLSIPGFAVGDSILIERNVFNKPTYFTNKNWGLKYPFILNFWYFFVALFITCLSFFFNDGLDKFTDKILWVTWTIDIFAITFFFLF